MKKILVFTFLFFVLSLSAYGQETQVVSQQFVDDATKAFAEVVALRAELKTAQESNTTKDAAIQELKTELKVKVQEIIDLKGEKVELREMIRFLMQHGRKKCYGICLQF